MEPSLASASPRTIYSRHRLQSVLGTCSLFVLALVAHSRGSNGLAAGLAVFGGLLGGYLLRRPRLRVDSHGVTVVNLVRTHRVAWSEIAGFGFGSGAIVPCLSIRRRDGSTVHAVVVTDDVRSGYPRERVEEIIADLQERRAAATGTRVDRELDRAEPGVEPRARRVSRRIQRATWVLLCLFFVVFGTTTAWHAASDLPRTYSHLRTHGVRATAVFAGCRVVGLRDHECRLSLTYRGHTRTWSYPEEFSQFDHLPVGAPVAVLVDPEHPTTVFTVHDVEVRSNAGFGVLAVFGIVLAVAGVLGLGLYWSRRRREARHRRLVAEASGLTG